MRKKCVTAYGARSVHAYNLLPFTILNATNFLAYQEHACNLLQPLTIQTLLAYIKKLGGEILMNGSL